MASGQYGIIMKIQMNKKNYAMKLVFTDNDLQKDDVPENVEHLMNVLQYQIFFNEKLPIFVPSPYASINTN